MKKIFIYVSIALGISSCGNKKNNVDASGTFETTETIIPAEANGVIKMFDITEGQILLAGQKIGYIDTVQLYLKKKQLQAQAKATLSQKPDIAKQLASLETQLKSAEKEQGRITNLLKSDAATPKQMDDANTYVESIKKQIDALYSSLSIQSNNISQQVNPLLVQIEQTNDQLAKCKIVNTVHGTVLTKYAEAYEMASAGKPLYKIADLSSMVLRAYVTGDQFAALKLNQQVTVLVDSSASEYKEYPGTVEWISNKAEFTPKTIQTKDERANLVYAIKVRVKNDGLLKIGMYADVKL
jgi:HlyD family secretion protein